MGSASDWERMKPACDLLREFEIPHEARALSAHRAPEALAAYLKDAQSRGAQVFIAGAGGAAHLPGVIASQTALPVLGVPIPTHDLGGLDSLLSIVQMPRGIPVATLAIGEAGAANAAILAAQILSLQDAGLRGRLIDFRARQTERASTQELDYEPGKPAPPGSRSEGKP
jgi:5-(carboxyamino)imidazole ribonucleotide mutase